MLDVFPKKGKRGGGYCIGWTLNFDSRILMNFTGKLNDVRTLAHEFGHLFNNELMKTKVSEVNYLTPLSTAEVASTFTEDFALEEISENLQSDEGKLSVLMARLIDDVSSIFRQVACFRLEQELHSKYRLKGFLSKRTIGDLFIKHMGNYLGEAVDMAGFENWWVYWHHIRYYFYVYSYASGQLISKALQVKVRKDQTFMEKYKEFLATGGLQSPKEAFLRIGIDITDANFWKLGLEEFERNFSEAKRLAKKLGKI
jgi:oligoendopeptidase F